MVFVLSIDEDKFRSTNSKWNELGLNKPSVVGYVSFLIESREFATKEDWEQYYYDSGLARLQDTQSDPKYFGRTKDELRSIAEKLYVGVKDNGFDLTLDDCVECVRFRVICETWNGIIMREHNTINNLKEIFTGATFNKTTAEFDFEYAIDYEVSKNSELVGALQIKPKSYTYNNEYINKAKKINRKKNKQYTKKYGVSVYNVVSDLYGNILSITK